jgi:hypothetical protein
MAKRAIQALVKKWCATVSVANAPKWRPPLLTLQHATIFSGDTWKVWYMNQIWTWYRNWRITSATQLKPLKSLFYMGYTSTWLDVRSCILMQEAVTFTIIYDGLSLQHLATVLISVFMLCYRPGLLFRGPPCMCRNDFTM